MFVSFLTYVPLFFWARGNITVSSTHWWKFRVHSSSDVVQDIDPDGRKRRSIGMIVSVNIPCLPIINISSYHSQLPTCVRRSRSSILRGPLGNTLRQCYTQFTYYNFCSIFSIWSFWCLQCPSLPHYTPTSFISTQQKHDAGSGTTCQLI